MVSPLTRAKYDWPMVRGDDETMVIVFPSTVDPADYDIATQLRTTPDFVLDPDDERLLATAAVDIDGQDVSIAFTHVQTLLLNPYVKVWYSVRITDLVSGITDTIIAGRVPISTSATEQEPVS